MVHTDDNQSRLLAAVSQIYRAAADPAVWRETLAQVGDLFRAHMCIYVLQDLRSRHLDVSLSRGADEALMAQYGERWAAHDFWLAQAPLHKSGDIVVGSDMFAPNRMPGTLFYEEFMKALDVEHMMAAVVADRHKNRFCYLSLQRSRRRGDFDEEDRSLLATLMPHLQNAHFIHHRLRTAETGTALAFASLDTLPNGIILYDQEDLPVFVNRAAERLIGGGDGLSWKRGRLSLVSTTENRRLHDLLARARITARGDGLESGGALRASRPSGQKAYILIVVPLRAGDGAVAQGTCALVIIDPLTRPALAASRLRESFDLTPAEIRLVRCLAGGLTIKDASDRLGIAVYTAKSQMTSVFEKTDTHRQSELLALLANLGSHAAPVVEGLEHDQSRSAAVVSPKGVREGRGRR